MSVDYERVATIAAQAARLAAREAVAEFLGQTAPKADLRAVPTPAETLAEDLAESVEKAEATEVTTEATTEATTESPRAPRKAQGMDEREAAVDLFLAEMLDQRDVPQSPADQRAAIERGEYVTPDMLLAAYDAWRHHLDAPAVPVRDLGYGMRRAERNGVLRFSRRQARGNDAGFSWDAPKPTLYIGLVLKTPTVAEAEAAEAAESEGPAPVPTEWTRSPSEDKHKGETTYAGQYPGREIPREFRDLIIPVLKRDTGWRYFKANGNGAGKPRLVSPSGAVHTLPNTPSDWRALKNMKGTLRQAGLAV